MPRPIFLCSFLFLLNSCISEKCAPDGNSLDEGGTLHFELMDARTGRELLSNLPSSGLPGSGSPYFRDSIFVYDQNKRTVTVRPIALSGEIGFTAYGSDLHRLPYNTALQRRFILYLNRADQDTIDVDFSLRKNDCGFAEFAQVAVRYNQQLVHEGSGTDIPPVVFRKK